jgi:hypothetical protein
LPQDTLRATIPTSLRKLRNRGQTQEWWEDLLEACASTSSRSVNDVVASSHHVVVLAA